MARAERESDLTVDEFVVLRRGFPAHAAYESDRFHAAKPSGDSAAMQGPRENSGAEAADGFVHARKEGPGAEGHFRDGLGVPPHVGDAEDDFVHAPVYLRGARL